MNPESFGMIELVLSFSLVLGFCVWQLVSVNRIIARRKAAEKETD